MAVTLAFYKVDEGSGDTLTDSSGNGNDATVSDVTTFWDDAQVAQSIQDAENAADALYFMDVDNHGVPKTQAEFLSDGVINFDKQRWFCSTAGLLFYKNPLTIPEAAEVEYFLYKKGCFEYEALIDAVSGDVLYDEVSGKLIFDEEA